MTPFADAMSLINRDAIQQFLFVKYHYISSEGLSLTELGCDIEKPGFWMT